MSTKFDDFLQEQLKDPEIRREYEALHPEHMIIQAMIDARQNSGITQRELAKRTGIAQGDISKLEKGLLTVNHLQSEVLKFMPYSIDTLSNSSCCLSL